MTQAVASVDNVHLSDGVHELVVPRAQLLAQSRMYAALIDEMQTAATLEVPMDLLTPAAIACLETQWFGSLSPVPPDAPETVAALINIADYLDAEVLLDYAWSIAYRNGWDVRPWLPVHLHVEYRRLTDEKHSLYTYLDNDTLSPIHARLTRLALRGPWPHCYSWPGVLWLACAKGSLSSVASLVAEHPTYTAEDYARALCDASEAGHHLIVDHLLADPRLDPRVCHDDAIRLASAHGHHLVVKRLLADPRVDPAVLNNIAIRVASKNGCHLVVDRLLADSRVDPSADQNGALVDACANGHHLVVARLLLHPRIDPSKNDSFCLRVASDHGRDRVVDILLVDGRVHPTVCNNDAIRRASRRGHHLVVDRLLMDPRVDPSANDNEAICRASEGGYLPTVNRLLLDPRVDPTARNYYAIHMAYSNCHKLVVDRLFLAAAAQVPST